MRGMKCIQDPHESLLSHSLCFIVWLKANSMVQGSLSGKQGPLVNMNLPAEQVVNHVREEVLSSNVDGEEAMECHMCYFLPIGVQNGSKQRTALQNRNACSANWHINLIQL